MSDPLLDPMQMTPEALLATARVSLECFALAVQPAFENPPHIRLAIEKIERLLAQRHRAALAVVEPPRHGKSLLCSILTPGYYMGRFPGGNIIVASYSGELSETWGRRVRNIMASPLFSSIFPECRLSPDSSAAHRFSTTAGGEAIFIGRGGAATGKGADLLILDDLVKDLEEATSDVICRSTIDWLKFVALTRLSRDGKILIIGTRWSQKDALGWLLRELNEN